MYPKIRLHDGTVVYPAKYRYVSYWGTWRRLLGVVDGMMYEIELTPINPTFPHSWEKMGERILYSSFNPDNKDKWTNDLPPDVWTRMGVHLTHETAVRLRNFDYFAALDRDKFALINNGGADFKDCHK